MTMELIQRLESEAIFVLRETAAQFARPALLFSGGKDSTCLVRLAEKAFRPGKFPFPLLHVDTGHNFPETLDFRDRLANATQERLIVRKVQDTIDRGRAEVPKSGSRNAIQSVTLMDAIRELGFDGVVGGARRDEEKARAKERFFSLRNELGQWDPQNQRPELWNLLNGRVNAGQHMRIFPLNNWTERDVWLYIRQEGLKLPSLYFSHTRACVRKKSGLLLAQSEHVRPGKGDRIEVLQVRCRTVGDVTCTGLLESKASTVDEVIEELDAERTSERGGRVDDMTSDTSMEDRKRQGYF